MPDRTDSATQVCFAVQIDGVDLGDFTACEGLSAEYEVHTYEEGGENGYAHRIPGRLKFGNITLTRCVDHRTHALASWFSTYRPKTRRSMGSSASITAYRSNGRSPAVIATWSLVDVWPVRWKGPSFGADQSGVAKESLELAHNGFKEEGR